jgi:hypothetical protein
MLRVVNVLNLQLWERYRQESLCRAYSDCQLLVEEVKEHIYLISTCKRLRQAFAEMHRKFKLRFVEWPLYSRPQRVKAAIKLLEMGDCVIMCLKKSPWLIRGTVTALSASKQVLTVKWHASYDLEGEEAFVRVRASQVVDRVELEV